MPKEEAAVTSAAVQAPWRQLPKEVRKLADAQMQAMSVSAHPLLPMALIAQVCCNCVRKDVLYASPRSTYSASRQLGEILGERRECDCSQRKESRGLHLGMTI